MVPNYQEEGFNSTPVAWPTFIPDVQFQLLFYFSSVSTLDLRCIFILFSPSCPFSLLHNGEKAPVRNTGFIFYKLQEHRSGI